MYIDKYVKRLKIRKYVRIIQLSFYRSQKRNNTLTTRDGSYLKGLVIMKVDA